MKCLIIFATVLHAVLGGHVSVQMPYLNPAGVTYFGGHTAYAAGPVAAGVAGLTTSTYYGNGHFLGRLATAPVAAAPVVATQLQHTVVPTVHQVPAVADVPVTSIQAQPGYIQKELDVAKPAVKTSRFELRRPAIQKQFYDIEERVIVRPAGSAVVELDQPHSKIHKSSVVSPIAPAHIAPAHFAPALFSPSLIAAASPAPPVLSPAPPSFIPAPPSFGPTPQPIQPIHDDGIASDEDSVVIEARRQPESQLRSRQEQTSLPLPSPRVPISQSASQPVPQQYSQQIPQQYSQQIPQQYSQQIPQQYSQPIPQQYSQQIPQQYSQQVPQQYSQQILQQYSQPIPQPHAQPAPQPILRSRLEGRLSQDQSGNQQRLIELLTAREGVADVGFGAPSFRNIGDAGQIRARVLSAEHAPKDSPLTGERVNTRRVVVSRPIETIEEVDVLEPVTKLERVAVQHPAVFKTAHVGIARVPTSVPVFGKAPVVQKTVYSHSPIYYK